jgi:hypothetical protein
LGGSSGAATVSVASTPPNSGYSAQVPIEIRDKSVESVTVALHRNVEIRGQIIAADGPIRLETLRVGLIRRSGVGERVVFPVAADGTFVMLILAKKRLSPSIRSKFPGASAQRERGGMEFSSSKTIHARSGVFWNGHAAQLRVSK